MNRDLNRRSVLVGAAGVSAAATALRPFGAEAATAPMSGAQAPGYYRYKVGSFEVTAITDGAATFPLPDNFVVNVPKPEVGAALAADYRDRERITVPFTPIVINTGSRVVVLDTGNGEGASAQSRGATGQFHANLKAAGFDRNTVDTVVISHFHGDHVNGLLQVDGKPSFPNAEILVPRVEWAYWMDDGEMSRAPKGRMEDTFRNNRRVFDALGRKVTPYEWDKEVVPGLTAYGTPGHTPGHTSYVVASGGHSVYVQSDVTNVPILFARNPGWHAFYDQDGAMAEATRRKVYDMVSAERILMQGFHYPFPGLAHLEKTASGYREVPAPWNPVL